MFNPCYEHCYLRSGKSYNEECDTTCEFAKAVADKKKLVEKLSKIYDFVKKNEDKWYDKYTGTDFAKDHLYSLRAGSFQLIRYFMEELGIEEIEDDD